MFISSLHRAYNLHVVRQRGVAYCNVMWEIGKFYSRRLFKSNNSKVLAVKNTTMRRHDCTEQMISEFQCLQHIMAAKLLA